MVRVLVVDDDRAFGEAVAEYLSREGFGIKVTNSSLEALEYLQSIESRERPDLIFADLQLPDVDGGALAATLGELGFHIPVIFMSSYSSWELSKLNIIPPEAILLQKPFALEHLVSVIRLEIGKTA
jgi:two-component system OmpR family response regulator